MSASDDVHPSAERVITQQTRKQRVYVDKETGRLWTEAEVDAWFLEHPDARR